MNHNNNHNHTDVEHSTYQFLFRSISHQLKLIGDEKLDKYELTNYQARILGYINMNEENGVSQVDLEKVTNRKGSSITSMLKVLEKNGFVTRKVDPKDERRKLIYTLPKAKELFDDFNSLFSEIEETITEGMTSKQKEELTASLKLILDNLSK